MRHAEAESRERQRTSAAPDSADDREILGGAALRSALPRREALVLLSVLAIVTGCIGKPHDPAMTRPVTLAADRATTRPSYWYGQPSPRTVTSNDFDALFRAAERATRELGFEIDRVDYRDGVLTSEPMVSAQFFEPWRRDVRTIDDAAQSSLATIRRALRFDFARLSGGGFVVSPKVLIEREARAERRVTSVTLYRRAFGGRIRPEDRPRGTRESDVGVYLPSRYWYPIGRDAVLESELAKLIEKRI